MSRLKRQRLTADGKYCVTVSGDEAANPRIEGVSSKTENKQLFVGSLPAGVTTESLTNLFSQSFPLKHAIVVVDPVTKKSRGYGFVTFADVEDARSAKEAFNRTLIEGQKIRVKLAGARQRQANVNSSVSSVNETKRPSRPNRQIPQSKPPPKLIVRNLPWSIKDSDQLAAVFRNYGKVKHAHIPPLKRPGRLDLSAGYGFVVLRGRKNAEKALEGVNGKEVEGRTLAVDWAVNKDVWDTVQTDDMKPEPSQQIGEQLAEVQDSKASKLEEGRDGETTDIVQDDEGPSDDVASEDTTSRGETSEEETAPQSSEVDLSTLFIRNLPFSCTTEILKEHFQSFGAVKYAKIVVDQATDRSRGTGFVCFVNAEDADACLREAPQVQPPSGQAGFPIKSAKASSIKQSLLEDTSKDLSRRFTIDGRILQVCRAVDRKEATRLTFAGNSLRDARDKDKRRLYLLSEGTVPADTPLYNLLSATEIKVREDSARQRQSLIRSNPALHLSLTRLSIRNLPPNITSKDLKALAREAVVGFAKDVKSGARRPLSKEERSRGGDEMREAEKARKAKGKGIVKQATVHFEGREGGKVAEKVGAGRSRGYGFVEYTSHQWALKGLRWLNGHAVGPSNGTASGSEKKGRKKRLIAEFAIDNIQVVERRREREAKARERSRFVSEKREKGEIPLPASKKILGEDQLMAKTRKGMKRKRSPTSGASRQIEESATNPATNDSDKISKRQQIIGRKRMLRRSRGKLAPT